MDINNYIVDVNIPLSEAVAQMTKNVIKGLVVLENGKVYGVFTRRDLVNCSHVFGIKDVSLKPFVNTTYDYSINTINDKSLTSCHSIIPVINENKQLLDIFFLLKNYHWKIK
ncbi:CBS domain-containing protein [Allocoprobacillus halotolerans]|uniref:CBS domain-containing protein n=1 Tax=Allocoprobacillus halotolerans TaxID=2944914 RepID=A0ABY5I082_9FIRM|nr:CBS domain-containing protein [Allocoprobacillus halotolerans]UTY38133.1 CBS domain-containing protein [Allocoprobacillus halotolerans]